MIISRGVDRNEDRKREYVKWMGWGVSSVVVLLGLFLERLPRVNLGTDWTAAFLLLWIFVYLLSAMLWELLSISIFSFVVVLVSVKEEPETPRTKMMDLFEIAGVRLSQIFVSPFAISLIVTVILLALGLVSTVTSWPLFVVAGLRLAWLAILAIIGFLAVSGVRQLLPEKEKIMRVLPPDYPPNVRAILQKREQRERLLSSGAYAVQLAVLLISVTQVLPLTYDVLQLGLLALGVTVILTGLWEVAWPLVQYFSGAVRDLQDIHRRLITGRIDAKGVASEVVSLSFPTEAREGKIP